MTAYFTTPLSQLTTRWRIFYEDGARLAPYAERTDYEELRGKGNDCRIYRHGQTELAVSTDTTYWHTRLGKLPGMRVKSGGVLVFDDTLLDIVAEAMRAYRRPQLSPEQRDALRERGRALA